MSSSITTASLYEKLKNRDKLLLLDVRSAEEYRLWQPFEALNIPLDRLKERLSKLPRDREIIVFCNRGKDSHKAVQILKKKGLKAASITGGLKEWNNIYDILHIKPEKESLFAVYQVKRLGKGCLSYIVVSPEKKKCIIIDPGRHDKIYLDFIKKNKLKPAGVLDTHLHADHISGSLKLAKKLKVPYFLSGKAEVKFRFKHLRNDLNKIFHTTLFRIIDVPGHTPEGVVIILGNSFIFTGDTLFIDMVGRPDLTGEQNTAQNARDLWESIKKKLFTLNENYFILPAHTQQQLNPGELMITATLRYVKRANEINLVDTVEDFVKNMSSNKTPAPFHHQLIKEINISGKIPKKDLDEMELGANRCAASI